MRIKGNYILYGINILTLMLIPLIVFFPNNIVRVILGLPLVLFFPAYTMLVALFPRRGYPDSIERIVFSFGLSLAIVPLIGLILNYSSWGIRLYPILGVFVYFHFYYVSHCLVS